MKSTPCDLSSATRVRAISASRFATPISGASIPSYTTGTPSSSGPLKNTRGATAPCARMRSTTGAIFSINPPVSRTLVMP